MESNSWSTRLSNASRRFQSRSDLYFGGGGGGHEETEGDDDLRAEFLCPFCAEDFDIVGLCCHIDEDHPVEVKNGVCPVCAKRVGSDIIGHITMQHASFFKVQRKRRLRKGSTFSMLRKELREGNLQSLLAGSSYFVPSINTEADPLLSSFIFSSPTFDESVAVQPPSTVKAIPSEEDFLERNVQQPLSDKDQEEKTRKSEFVQGLLLSTILDDDL
ncbi:Di19 domain-containing protein [Cephalotus follicularis]|uniref:Di19 domain-containing protein n=1 Tax=Cephalotus follicularis TaxID=3775 RepID=A0A1Q3DEZ4_CEPFO|nr:Di19 domain-containing protein [Cephalotus follicularis]